MRLEQLVDDFDKELFYLLNMLFQDEDEEMNVLIEYCKC